MSKLVLEKIVFLEYGYSKACINSILLLFTFGAWLYAIIGTTGKIVTNSEIEQERLSNNLVTTHNFTGEGFCIYENKKWLLVWIK